MQLIEILGIVAGVLVLVSFLFKNILIIRGINMVGCAAFVGYGAYLGAWSIVGLNGALFFVQIFFLTKYFLDKKKKQAEPVEQVKVAETKTETIEVEEK